MNLSGYHKKALFELHAELTLRLQGALISDHLIKAQISALRKVLLVSPTSRRDDENADRKKRIAKLIYSRWNKLEGDCYERAEQISEIGKRKGIWATTTWCQPTILNHAVSFGFIPENYYQLWKAAKGAAL